MLLIKTTRDQILAPFQSVCGIVEKRHTLPILSNVLFEKNGNQLMLTATDIEIQIRTNAEGASGVENIAVTVNARKLLDILRSFPGSSEVSLLVDDKRLQVRVGKSRFNLQTLPSENYPRILQTENIHTQFSLTQAQFKRLLSRVQYAMAQQDVRYYLNGLLLIISDSECRVVTTDGHRLAFASEPLQHAFSRIDVILPRKTVLELSRLLADNDDPLDIQLTSNQVTFRFGNIELISKLIDGKFPDYERVIPTGNSKVLQFSRALLLQSLQRAAILTNEKFRSVRWVLNNGSLKIMSINTDQEEACEELEIDYNGEPIDIGFNVTYLLDVLNNLNVETIECHLAGSNSSALIMLPGSTQFKYVVMPMRM